MKKFIRLSLISLLLISGCSFSGSLEDRYKDLISVPGFTNSNSLSYDLKFEIPNNGQGLTEREFYTSYSDLYDYSYVLDNIQKVEDENTREKLENIYNIFNSNLFHKTNEYTGRYKGYNIINIIGETLEIRFAHPVLTPNLWNIMNNSMYFENYYVSEFQEGATCNTEFMSHASLYPVVTSIWSGNMCQNENTTNDIFKFAMPAQLEANGYNAYYFHLGFRGFYNRGNFIPNFGFKKNNVKFLQNLGLYEYTTDDYNIKFYERFIDFSKPFYVSNLTYSMHGDWKEGTLGINDERANRVLTSLEKDKSYFNDMEEIPKMVYLILFMARLQDFCLGIHIVTSI